MSYQCLNGECPRILRISSRTLTYRDQKFGDRSHDNARQINEKKNLIANYRKSIQNNSTLPLRPLSTPAPSVLTCNWNESLLEIILQTDDKPQETSWQLQQSNGQVIEEYKQYSQPNQVTTHQNCVKAGACYKFIISDNGGDGLSGGAHFKIIDAGQTVVENADFRTSQEQISFGVEGTRKYKIGWQGQNNLPCRWLQTRKWKKNDECSRPYIKAQCAHVCRSCI